MGARLDRKTGGSLALVLVSACGHAATPSPTPPGAGARADGDCAIHGVVDFFQRPSVFAAPTGDRELGLLGGRIGVDVLRIEGTDRARVAVRSAVEGPALHLDGYLSVHELPVHTARAVDVIPGHVTIKEGTPVSLRAQGPRGTASVSVLGGLCATPLTQSIAATLRCAEDLALGDLMTKPPRPSPQRPATSHRQEITYADDHASIPVLASPDGPVILELAPKDGPFLFELVETRGSARHVRFDQEVLIDGWITAPPLVSEDRDRWGCGSLRDAYDACAVVPASDDVECPDLRALPTATTSSSAPVRNSPAGDVIGKIDRGVRVHVLERRGEWASVTPVVVTGAIAPPRAKTSAFWIPGAAL